MSRAARDRKGGSIPTPPHDSRIKRHQTKPPNHYAILSEARWTALKVTKEDVNCKAIPSAHRERPQDLRLRSEVWKKTISRDRFLAKST
ncbi:unnamed protein product [Linum trigynum]|uniref:Uncharacterized protein n=1 Tax=Linum trigynum TaxID=586398 RepID=A0AAV2GRU9_9ROSI